MSYHHLSTFERGRIEELSALGYSNRAISKRLKRHRSSIDRELQRNTTGSGYEAECAQIAYHTRRKQSKPKGKLSDHLAAIITDKLSTTWSPEQIANTVTSGNVSFKTIYIWLYAGKLKGATLSVLRQKGKRRKAE